jgi:hypothetical protein
MVNRRLVGVIAKLGFALALFFEKEDDFHTEEFRQSMLDCD